MQAREWILTAAVIVVPLIIAVVVTLWSLDQVRYRPQKRRPVGGVARETPADATHDASGGRVNREDRQPAAPDARGTDRAGDQGAISGASGSTTREELERGG